MSDTAVAHAPTVHSTTAPVTKQSEARPVATVRPRPQLLPKERYACTRATD